METSIKGKNTQYHGNSLVHIAHLLSQYMGFDAVGFAIY